MASKTAGLHPGKDQRAPRSRSSSVASTSKAPRSASTSPHSPRPPSSSWLNPQASSTSSSRPGSPSLLSNRNASNASPSLLATGNVSKPSPSKQDPVTPTPMPRKKSNAAQLQPGQYRYSLGPAPVRFPGSVSPEDGQPPLSRSRSPSPVQSSRRLNGGSSSMSLAGREQTSAKVVPAKRSAEQSVAGPSSSKGSSALAPNNKRAQTQARMEDSASTPSSSHLALPAADGSSGSLLSPRSRPPMSNRPSSRVFVSFPFPHPVTPKGNSEDESKILGFGWVGRLLHGLSGKGSEDKNEQEAVGGGRGFSESDALLANSDGRSSNFGSTANTNQNSLRPSTTSRPRYGSAAVPVVPAGPHRHSLRSSLSTNSSENVDPSDPYGYRRLAGPDLLPTYHEEHVLPRRMNPLRRAAWRRRVFLVLVAVALLVLVVALFDLAVGTPGDEEG